MSSTLCAAGEIGDSFTVGPTCPLRAGVEVPSFCWGEVAGFSGCSPMGDREAVLSTVGVLAGDAFFSDIVKSALCAGASLDSDDEGREGAHVLSRFTVFYRRNRFLT